MGYKNLGRKWEWLPPQILAVKSLGQHHCSASNDSQAGFKRAMDLVREEFLQRLDFYQHSWLPARTLVEEALAQRFQVQAWEEALRLRD